LRELSIDEKIEIVRRVVRVLDRFVDLLFYLRDLDLLRREDLLDLVDGFVKCLDKISGIVREALYGSGGSK